jgi:hypothetical protein
MAQKKQVMSKDFNKLLDQAKDKLKKVGQELTVLAKKSEKEIVKASKTGKIQLDIVGLNMQKEKLYYDIGKKVVSLNAKKSLNIEDLQPLLKKVRTISTDARQKKRELTVVRKEEKA